MEKGEMIGDGASEVTKIAVVIIEVILVGERIKTADRI
jgi:hypothetical protein